MRQTGMEAEPYFEPKVKETGRQMTQLDGSSNQKNAFFLSLNLLRTVPTHTKFKLKTTTTTTTSNNIRPKALPELPST